MDLAPYAGAMQVAGYVAIGGVGLFVLLRIYSAGKDRQLKKQLEEEAKNHNEFHAKGEDWDAAGGLGGAAKRVSKSKD